ncbi:serine/threonine-protein kinase [Alkalimonas sp.]|uniref:serine/threonine-protein kinase n=1 Tax=Alkalimonas sp. TaxID=1872453 RepID=UPI00263B0752|nr:serine/threonine-protein kinase [Alkalimonas sp.]MCC5825371.1 serine/threonine protein kinase [Alkalimonas sp.]
MLQQRYLIENLLGSGGISHIYRARDTFLEQAGIPEPFVAIKVLQKQFVDQPEALQLLLQEARKTQQLAHPNIIRLFDVSSDDGHFFLVMEYLDGETLEQVINRYKPKGLPFKFAQKLLEQIADGLAYAHQQGIVHADLKPANIMLDRNGHVKLLDFGVAQKLQQNIDIYAAQEQSQATPVNGFTPAYASAELLQGQAPTPSDDVYSFACLVYELLTSKHPFSRVPADKAQRENKKASKPAHLNSLQWSALRRALAFDGSQRTSSVRQLMRRLKRPVWPLVVGTAAGIMTITAAISYLQGHQNSLQELQRAVKTHQETLSYQASLIQLQPAEVLEELEKLTDHNPIISSGLLNFHTSAMLSYFEQQIDGLLSERTERYPNYSAIEYLSDKASQLYPDSHQLAGVRNRVARSKQSSVEILQNQLAAMLAAQKYSADGDLNNPFQVLADLKRIDPSYQPQPNEEAVQLFLQEFEQAMSEHNAARLQELLAIGQAAFYRLEQTQPLIEQGLQMQSAIDTMAFYQQQLQQGAAAEFPYAAAEVFYQYRFNALATKLEQSERPAEVDAVYDQWQHYAAIWPNDFELSVRLRRQLADKYLALSGELLETHQVRNAERLMRRANELMVSVSG